MLITTDRRIARISKLKLFAVGLPSLLSVAAALFFVLLTGTAGAQGNKYMATGSGQVRINGELRNFAFSAIKDRDGDVSGQAQLNNRNIPIEDHVDVRCLSVVGNTATVSGIITKSKSKDNPAAEFAVGTPVIFRVQDNGEGANDPPDLITLEYPTGATGTDPLPCDVEPPFALPYLTVEKGNIQVQMR